MPYFIDIERRQVVVMPPGATPTAGQRIIDGDTAAVSDLRHGQLLTEAQMTALLDGSPSAYRAASPQDSSSFPAPQAAEHHRTESPPPRTRSAAAARASGVAGVVEAMAWLFLVLSLIGGLALALQTRTDEFGFEDRPYIAAGLSIAIAGAFQALVVIMFATYIKARTE